MDPALDWADLPMHLLDLVLDRLELVKDYLQFSMVCKQWYRVAKDSLNRRSKLPSFHPPPMLLINTEKEDTWKVYNVVDNKLLDLEVSVPNTRFCGSSKGWLVYVESNLAVTLVNPFLKVRGNRWTEHSTIHLPPLKLPECLVRYEDYHNYVRNATISADPILCAKDYIVLVTYMPSMMVAFMRPGKDRKWTYLDKVARCGVFQDVIFTQHKIYAVNQYNRVLSFENTSLKSASRSFRNIRIKAVNQVYNRYLVYLDKKELLMVQRYMSYDSGYSIRTTLTFVVYGLNIDTGKWMKKKSLGDVALFVGDNTSIAVSASSFQGCLPNCIYFTHDTDSMLYGGNFGPCGRPHDFGVYSIQDKSFLPIETTVVSTLVKMSNQTPIWILPTVYLQINFQCT